MGDFFLTSMTDVGCPALIHPEWSFGDRTTLIRSQQRTQGGKLFSYVWSKFRRYSVPLSFVDSETQSSINAWWENQEEVAFTLDTSVTESTVLCRLVNAAKPLGAFVRPYVEFYEGRLQLEALQDISPTRRPFILDDSVSGLLDQNNNALIG